MFKSFLFSRTLYFPGVRCVKSVLGLPTTDPKEEAERDDEDPIQQLQDLCPSRHRPESVVSLTTKTGFTNNQIRRLYRGFKSECPSGILTEESFHKIYSTFFPGRELSYNDNLCSFTHYLYSLMACDISQAISIAMARAIAYISLRWWLEP